MTPLGFCFCAPSLILTGQVLLVVTQAEHIAEWVHNPVRLTSEPWGPTKLRSWHPSDHRPKSPKAHTSQAGAGDFNYLGSSAPSQMFSPPRKLKDSFLSFQEKDTSAQPHPESDQFTVPHQRLTNKMTPPRKLPGNILKLNGDQNQPPQFKSISSMDQAADNQLYEILVPPLDSKSSGVTKFIVSLQDLKKDLAQHKKRAKVVVGTSNQLVKPQLQNKTVEDDYGDPSMTEANSDSLPVQSQENRKEPPEPSEQVEPPEYQLEAQTQDSEDLGVVQEGPDSLPLLPEENEPQKEEPVPQFVSEIAALEQPEINGPSPDRNKAQHSNLSNVTAKPEDLEITVSEADKETQQTLSQQQVPGHLPESPELVESSLTQQEAPVQLSEDLEEVAAPQLIQQEVAAPNSEFSQELEPSLSQQESLAPIPELSEFLEPPSTQEEAPDELPEDLETSGSQLEVLALPTKPYEEVNPPIEQEAPVPTPESSMESVVGAPAATVPHPSQNQVHHYTLHRTTVKPVDVTVTITSQPFKEVGMSPVQEEIPTQTPGPLVEAEHFPSLEQQPAELSESPEEVDSSESGLEDQIQLPEEAEEEEEEPSPIQQEVQSVNPGPLLEDESFPIELEQPAQPSEFLEEEGLGPGNQPEAFAAPAELPEEAKPPIELPAPLQAPESAVENVGEIPPVHQMTIQPTQSEEHHYQLPNVTVRPVDVTLTITSEPTKEMESSLTQQESLVHPPENTEEIEPFLKQVQTEQIPSEATLQPMDMEFPITPYAATFSTERELLVQMKPNSSMTTNICDFCLCENETLLCSHLSPKRKLHQVPVPRPEIHKHPITVLNFQGNSISYIEKHVWKAYRWTETLILSENLLTELHKDTFEGLLSLQVLDVSCNKIRYIERRTFESLPFVKYMNLGCNLLTELSFGTFQAWHGMQFLQKLILSRNPLTVVEDPYFYKLPALKYLDLGTTQVPLTALENILMTTLELERLILPKHMVCCLCKYKADIEIVCKTIKLHCHIGCLINTTYCLEASIGNPEGPFMKVLQSRKENTSTELAIEPESSALEKDALSSSGFMNEPLDFNDESDVISALNYILPYFSEGNLEDVVSTLLPFIKLLFSNIQNVDDSLEPYKNDSKSLAPVPKASKMAYKNKLNKLYFLENLLDAEIDEVRKKEKTAMLMQQSSRLGSKFKRRIFEKRWEPAQAEESSLAEIEKAEKRLHRMNRVLKGTGSIQKRHFKDESAKSLWSKQSDQAPVENITKDGQKPRKLVGNSFHSEPLLPKEHGEAVSSSPEQSLVDEAPTTKSLPEFIERRKDLSYTLYVLESANANVKRTKGSNPNFQSEERHRNLRKKKSHFQLIAKKPASSVMRSLVNSPAGGVFPSLGDLGYAEEPFSELYAASEPSTEKPPENNHTTTVNTGGSSFKPTTTTVSERAASETTTPENLATELNGTTSNLIPTAKQTSEPPLDFVLGSHSHDHFKEYEYPLVMSPGDQFESHLNKQLRPLIPNNNVRRLISHVIRTLKMDCTDSRVQLSCAKLISRTGLLMKLLSEQQEFKLSRTDWDTEQWKTENYLNETTEAQGEQKGLEPSQLTKAVPGYGYNNKVILAISVTVVVTVLIIIFCLIEVYSHRATREGDEEKSTRQVKEEVVVIQTRVSTTDAEESEAADAETTE
ncbi:leucine-rich repeat-containing protein 37A-like [Onychomys torridus]|uniref:leucine-rich repeat-containing protein 37A-like n=1 Tax=Onychomys torridus TaxID=38674 RepID=UPI00167F9541|nr:leucine-rich repeat-containing protein 37A-like [Onychomys torridus]